MPPPLNERYGLIEEIGQGGWRTHHPAVALVTRTQDPEIRALLKAGEELKCDNLLVLTEDDEKVETKEWYQLRGRIRFVPLWKWLAADDLNNRRQET